MRIYLAGPMTGVAEHNFPAFAAAAARLREAGHDVVNPAEINADADSLTWEECMRRDLPVMLSCEGVACLPGWEGSRGASLEVLVMRTLGHPVLSAESLTGITERARCGLGRESLEAVAADAAAWAAKTFPHACNNSVAEHLLREAGELSRDPTDPEEMADCYLLLSRLALTNGIDLAAASRTKLEKNKLRAWGEPDAAGVVQHVAEAA